MNITLKPFLTTEEYTFDCNYSDKTLIYKGYLENQNFYVLSCYITVENQDANNEFILYIEDSNGNLLQDIEVSEKASIKIDMLIKKCQLSVKGLGKVTVSFNRTTNIVG